jgi:hypothetical protein
MTLTVSRRDGGNIYDESIVSIDELIKQSFGEKELILYKKGRYVKKIFFFLPDEEKFTKIYELSLALSDLDPLYYVGKL